MKYVIGLTIAFTLITAAALAFNGGSYWTITMSHMDIEGYPVYYVYKNGAYYARASSRAQAESYTKTEAQHRQEMKAIWDRGWEIARTSQTFHMDGTPDEVWRVWFRDGNTVKTEYFRTEFAAKTFVEARKQ